METVSAKQPQIWAQPLPLQSDGNVTPSRYPDFDPLVPLQLRYMQRLVLDPRQGPNWSQKPTALCRASRVQGLLHIDSQLTVFQHLITYCLLLSNCFMCSLLVSPTHSLVINWFLTPKAPHLVTIMRGFSYSVPCSKLVSGATKVMNQEALCRRSSHCTNGDPHIHSSQYSMTQELGQHNKYIVWGVGGRNEMTW